MNFLKRVWDALYSKVKAQAIGGTLGGTVSGAILWLIEEGTGKAPSEAVTGLVVAGSAVLVGTAFGVQTSEKHPPGPKQVADVPAAGVQAAKASPY